MCVCVCVCVDTQKAMQRLTCDIIIQALEHLATCFYWRIVHFQLSAGAIAQVGFHSSPQTGTSTSWRALVMCDFLTQGLPILVQLSSGWSHPPQLVVRTCLQQLPQAGAYMSYNRPRAFNGIDNSNRPVTSDKPSGVSSCADIPNSRSRKTGRRSDHDASSFHLANAWFKKSQ